MRSYLLSGNRGEYWRVLEAVIGFIGVIGVIWVIYGDCEGFMDSLYFSIDWLRNFDPFFEFAVLSVVYLSLL